jgi:O-antigen/teichoic acid export membrane protein
MSELPFPKSFPNNNELEFLKLALCDDAQFPTRWATWKASVVFDDIDHATVRLLPLIYRRLSAHRMQHDELFGRIEGVYKTAWVKNQRLITNIKQTLARCETHHIPVLILKGIPLLNDIYRDRGARFLGDADILIRPEHAPQIVELMLSNGWKYDKDNTPDVHNPVPSIYHVMKSTGFINGHGIKLDIHWTLFDIDKYPASPRFRDTAWRVAVPTTIDTTPCLRLSNEDMLIHVIIHGSEGNAHRTLRWVTDASALIRTMPIDWHILAERAHEFGFVPELYFGGRFLKDFLGENIPESFFENLSITSLSHAQLQSYYRRANTLVSQNYTSLGNLPLLWHGYWDFEEKRKFPYVLVDCARYLATSWGIRIHEFPAFVFTKMLQRLRSNKHINSALSTAADGFTITTGRAISFLASFMVFTVLGAHVPRDVVGTYTFVMAAFSIMSITTLPGMNNALVRAVARGHEGTMKAMLTMRFRYGLLGSVLCASVGVFFFIVNQTELAYAFLLAAPFVPITDTFSNFAINFWQGKKNFMKSASTSALYYIGLALFSIPLMMISNNLLVILGGVLTAQTCMGLIVYATAKKTENDSIDADSIHLGKHLTIMHTLRIAAAHVDRLIIWAFIGPAATAIYSFAALPVSKAQQLIPIGAISLPHLSTQDFTHAVKKNIFANTLILFGISIPGTVVVLMLAPWIYSLLFPLYPESTIFFQILFLPLALSPILLLKTSLVAAHRTQALYVSDIISPLFKIGAMLACVVPFGLLGVAVGSVIGSLVEALLVTILFLREKPISTPQQIKNNQ